jgi:pimeloyl-ACP methyl ester carboxylesterase
LIVKVKTAAKMAGLVLAGVLALAAAIGLSQAPSIAAGGLLYPWRRGLTQAAPDGCTDAEWRSGDITLHGWRCAANGRPRGTVVFLHGVADNRGSSVGIIAHFRNRGYDVVAYDSRANGQSTGEICTYGYYEKQDLSRVIDTIEVSPVIVVGGSLGAAVALQAAPEDDRIRAVVAAETFSDLHTIAIERAPWILTPGMIRKAFLEAEQRGRFVVDEVSPVRAATRISIPVFLVHGADDRDTPPDHSRRVFAALRGPKRLRIVERARHGASLTGEVLLEVDRWLDDNLR